MSYEQDLQIAEDSGRLFRVSCDMKTQERLVIYLNEQELEEENRKIEAEKTPERRLERVRMAREGAYVERFGGIQGQLDFIYHNTLAAWKAEIKKIKDAHPKPE